MQSKAGKNFVHEAYRYQALPPESRDGFASSMAARASPRAAAAADGGDVALSSFSSAAVRPRPNQTSGGRGGHHGEGLRAIGIVDEEGSSSCEEEGGGSRDAELEESWSGPAARAESEGRDDARAAPASGGAGLVSEGEEKEAGGGGSFDASIKTGASPSRRSWGAGLRMYV